MLQGIIRFVARTAFALLLVNALTAAALEPATGKVILTVSGKIAEKNSGNTANFDLEMLEKLPAVSFTTQTPWDKHPVKFTGPLLRDVLAAVKATGTTMHAVAVNDYKTAIPVSDAHSFGMILAYKMNDQPISLRTKGPLFIVYPFDAKPELQTDLYYGRSAWQLRWLEIE